MATPSSEARRQAPEKTHVEPAKQNNLNESAGQASGVPGRKQGGAGGEKYVRTTRDIQRNPGRDEQNLDGGVVGDRSVAAIGNFDPDSADLYRSLAECSDEDVDRGTSSTSCAASATGEECGSGADHSAEEILSAGKDS